MNGGKQLMGPILLLWVEKGGGGDSSLHLVYACMMYPLFWLAGMLCRLTAAFLLSVAKLQPLLIGQLLSVVHSKKGKGQLEVGLAQCFRRLSRFVPSAKNCLVTENCSCIHLAEPWFCEEDNFCILLFVFFVFVITELSWGLWAVRLGAVWDGGQHSLNRVLLKELFNQIAHCVLLRAGCIHPAVTEGNCLKSLQWGLPQSLPQCSGGVGRKHLSHHPQLSSVASWFVA